MTTFDGAMCHNIRPSKMKNHNEKINKKWKCTNYDMWQCVISY